MPKNRLIITWKDESPNKWNVSRESFKCSNPKKILSKRNKNNILFATFYDKDGVVTIY